MSAKSHHKVKRLFADFKSLCLTFKRRKVTCFI